MSVQLLYVATGFLSACWSVRRALGGYMTSFSFGVRRSFGRGHLLISHFDLNSRAADGVTTVLGVMLLITAIALLFRRRLLALGGSRLAVMCARQTSMLTIFTGAALGVLVNTSSVGAGTIGVTALLLLFRGCPWRASWAPTSRTPCRLRWSPGSGTGCLARSIYQCWHCC
jgi:hypothetical protein